MENVNALQVQEQEILPVVSYRRVKLILLVCLCAAAALFAIYIWLCFQGSREIIHEDVSVNGVALRGMTKLEASEAVQKKFEDTYAGSAYEVKMGGETFEVPVFSCMALDASEEIENAYELGHGDWFSRGWEYLQNLINKERTEITIEPYLTDTSSVDAAAEEIAKAVYVPGTGGEWHQEGNSIVITAGSSEQKTDPDRIREQILDGLKNGKYSGIVESDITLTASAEVSPEEIAAAVNVPVRNAAYAKQDGQVVVVPEESGRQVLASDIEALLTNAEEGTTFSLEMTEVAPEVTAEQLQAELFRDVISSYTVVSGMSPTQLNNQGLASAAINGTILLTGEEFSFNEVVGDTTAEKGYVEDYAYNNGKLITEVGGGVCRVASTLYAAVLYTNLEITLRYNHSSPVHYLPLGMDATVSYPLPDLRFRNNQGHPIKIEMYLGSDGYLYVTIYGTRSDSDPYVDVQLDYITDMMVDTYREYYDYEGGNFLKEEFISRSTYKELQYPDEEETEEETYTEETYTEEAYTEEAYTEETYTEEAYTEEAYTEEAYTEETYTGE